MKFNFEKIADRTDTGSMKFERTPDFIKEKGAYSFFGAEFDFKTAPCIINALLERVRSGMYGFTLSETEGYLSAVRGWMKDVREWDIKKGWLVPTYGTIKSINTAIAAFTNPGDGIIIQPPVYHKYMEKINNSGRVQVDNPLIYHNGKYTINFNQLEECMSHPANKLMILCNPHNPIMTIWGLEDLTRIAELAKRHDVLVISDEIFAEVNFCKEKVVPYAAIEAAKNNSIICTSIGKTFNFTGGNHANIIIPSDEIREKFIEQRNLEHYASMDPFMRTAVLAAYSDEGKAWLDEFKKYTKINIKITQQFFEENFPKVRVCEHKAGSLIWVDWNGLGISEKKLHEFLLQKALFMVDVGSDYGKEGTCFTRIQLGTPRKELKQALERLLDKAIEYGYVEQRTKVKHD